MRSIRSRAWAGLALAWSLFVCSSAPAAPLPDLHGAKLLAVTENAFPPLNMLDPKTGKGVGLEYDLVNEIGRRLNLKVEWHVSSWDAMIQAVRDGQFDIGMDGITINAERLRQIDFSIPYLRSELHMLVRADERRFNDPAGFRANAKLLAGAQPGTTSFYATAKELLGGRQTDPRLKLFETFGATAQALRAGDVDVVLSDATAAKGLMARYPNTFKLVGTALASEDYGLILRKGSPLLAPVNAALQAMKADGTLDRLGERWFAH